ncbi:MAG: sugar transferase [Bacteroidales bacterium]
MKIRTKISIVFVDILFVIGAFCSTVAFKPTSLNQYLVRYSLGFAGFLIVWIVISLISNKFEVQYKESLLRLYWRIIKTNFMIMGIILVFMFLLRDLHYSRFIVFGTIGLATLFEFIFSYFHYYLKYAKNVDPNFSSGQGHYSNIVRPFIQPEKEETVTLDELMIKEEKKIKEIIVREAGKKVYLFIANNIDIDQGDYIIFSTTTRFNIDRLPALYFNNIVNLKRINDIRFVNKFFETVNAKIAEGGKFIGCVETKSQRKKRILKKYPPVLKYIYYTGDFIIKRIFPKFTLTKSLYFYLTRGNNRVISKAETIGRLYSCGFKLIGTKEIDGYLYFTAKKVQEPYFDENPTYGPFVKLARTGKNGKIIYVYKLRTMHPFAEYIQDYVYEQNSLKEGGKFHNDFRITTLGKIFRMFWIDELPMFINFFKGDMKLVGVRPLSKQYFNLYSPEVQERRKKYKPGLIPPFYVDMPGTLEEIQASEMKYFDAYDKHPLRTDFLYFWKAVYNIALRKKRSS